MHDGMVICAVRFPLEGFLWVEPDKWGLRCAGLSVGGLHYRKGDGCWLICGRFGQGGQETSWRRLAHQIAVNV